MSLWLINEAAGGLLDTLDALKWQPTAEQERDVTLRIEALRNRDSSRFVQASGAVSKVSIVGALTAHPSPLAFLFGGGGSSYPEIIQALAYADADPNTSEIEAFFDSPGGQVSGLFETIAAAQAVKKPIKVVAASAESAAYALAAAMGPIRATSLASGFGSIGIMAKFRPDPGLVTLRSSESPNKNPDPATEAGQAELQEYIDGLHELFVGAIASGRGIEASAVNKEFGRGKSFLATEALRRGMIDAVDKPKLRAVGGTKHTASGETGASTENNNMDLKTLKAQHPDVATALVQEGVTQERERVQAHLTMGEQCGDMKIATKAIQDGTAFGHAPTQALYMGAAMNRRDVAAHTEDTKTVEEATSGAAQNTAEKDLGDQLAEAMLGKETK